jgi:F0F1-type ATP synthase membrane subunit c/vacuolar-type H+-ATPase subunit K
MAAHEVAIARHRDEEEAMRTLLIALGVGLGGYVVGVATGIALVSLLSPNQHDRSLEAVMTGFFVTGPLVAILAALGTVIIRLARS